MAKVACYACNMAHKTSAATHATHAQAHTLRTPAKLRSLAPGVSMRQLSKRSGIGMPHLSRLFSGKRGLTIRTARRIARALDLHSQRVIDTVSPDKRR